MLVDNCYLTWATGIIVHGRARMNADSHGLVLGLDNFINGGFVVFLDQGRRVLIIIR